MKSKNQAKIVLANKLHLGGTTCQEDDYLGERLALKNIPRQLVAFRMYGIAKNIVFYGTEA